MKRGQSARSHLVLQLVGLGYVGYLLVGLVQDYLAGESPVTLPVFCLMTGGLAAVALVLAFFAYRGWKRDRNAENDVHHPERARETTE